MLYFAKYKLTISTDSFCFTFIKLGELEKAITYNKILTTIIH